jgi:hypothetical protein
LPGTFDAEATFSAAAAFVIRSDGFSADPDGFFQISWGLWNSTATGLDRTGSFQNFAADTFELIEFDYYPNVSPFFGGPFLAPSVFGAEVDGDAFANFTSLFDLDVALPLDTPLLAVLEHRPDLDVVVLGVHRIVDSGRVVPLDGAVGGAPLAFLSLREYDLDTIGLTLWKDSFGGPTPALVATLDFHAMTVVSGLVGRPESARIRSTAGPIASWSGVRPRRHRCTAHLGFRGSCSDRRGTRCRSRARSAWPRWASGAGRPWPSTIC